MNVIEFGMSLNGLIAMFDRMTQAFALAINAIAFMLQGAKLLMGKTGRG